MSLPTMDPSLKEALAGRFRLRLQTALTLARADRFFQDLEPSDADRPDLFKDLAEAFRLWRRALAAENLDDCLDASEVAWVRLEAYRGRVEEQDAAIEAFRVRWACENAPLGDQTLDNLACFYRLLPLSTRSQSKYEYVLTRLLAGPLRPRRTLPHSDELLRAVAALEESWGAETWRVDDVEVATIAMAVKSFGYEASQREDAAAFTAAALLRRFGAFKASIGEKLFDPRLSVAVVEANVRVLNILNQLLADAGVQPLRAPRPPRGRTSASRQGAEEAESAPSPEGRRRGKAPITAEIDLSALEIVVPRNEAPGGSLAADSQTGVEAPDRRDHDSEEAAQPADFLGASLLSVPLEFTAADLDLQEEGMHREQRPSSRAAELAKIEANAAIIRRYLKEPRSPEVWRLNLDSFLGGRQGPGREGGSADRRRALELILAADDLICSREKQGGPPTEAYRVRVRDLAQSMLRLQSSLRRAGDRQEGGERELGALLYVSDHLLWERLRLSASLKRNPARKRGPVRPRRTQTGRMAEAARRRSRVLRRDRRVLLGVVATAALLAAAAAWLSVVVTPAPVPPEVALIRVAELPEAQIFDDARAYRNRLFVTAGPSWTRLGRAEKLSIVRSLATFAAVRNLDTVSVVGRYGETWATFKDNVTTLDSDLFDFPGGRS